MPPESGFDLLPHVPADTRVVFVTAHEEHAIRAFEENAVDYLLKPIKPERLSKTLKRLRETATAVAVGDHERQVDLGNGSSIPLHEITAVAADGNYSRVHLLGGGNFHVRRPMHEWVAKLEGRGFIQPGRSLLLLASAVQHVDSPSRDENYLYLTGVAEPLKLGRSISFRVRQLMGL
jgi:two-component system LytT family response regulator